VAVDVGFRDNRGMIARLSRRTVLAGLAAGFALPRTALAAQPFDAAADFGVAFNTTDDQSGALQKALDAAHDQGRALLLPPGQIFAHGLELPASVRISGQPGLTVLVSVGDTPIAKGTIANDLVFEDVGFSGGGEGPVEGLIQMESSVGVLFSHCSFILAAGIGLATTDSALTVEDSTFDQLGDAAIHAMDSRGIIVRGNRISACGNAGVRIWRSASGLDSSIVSGNRIERIDSKGGGNGQNGNGVNVFRADAVIVSDNVISDCAFTAVRVNAGKNTQVRGNTCLNSGEVAIFSEFEFSGSVIADNVIDGAATGISVTNLDSGGHLATVTGNLVRNIAPRSLVNPDTRPVGIFAEADTVVSGNTVDAVPGVGIAAGYGPFLRNVLVNGNVVTGSDYGIAVSVVQQQSPGPVRVSGNMIAAKHGIVGLEWENMVSDDLARDAARYPNVTVADNTIAG
jgi:uncharacterized secreted repeat protein (TIGR03808 family)